MESKCYSLKIGSYCCVPFAVAVEMAKSLKRNMEFAEFSQTKLKKEEGSMNSCLDKCINQAKKLLDESNSLDLQFLKCEIRNARSGCVVHLYKYYPTTCVFNLGSVLFDLDNSHDGGEMSYFQSFDLKLFQQQRRICTENEINRYYADYEENWNLIVSVEDEVSYTDKTKHLPSCLRPSFEENRNSPVSVYDAETERGNLICPFCGASVDIYFE